MKTDLEKAKELLKDIQLNEYNDSHYLSGVIVQTLEILISVISSMESET